METQPLYKRVVALYSPHSLGIPIEWKPKITSVLVAVYLVPIPWGSQLIHQTIPPHWVKL